MRATSCSQKLTGVAGLNPLAGSVHGGRNYLPIRPALQSPVSFSTGSGSLTTAAWNSRSYVPRPHREAWFVDWSRVGTTRQAMVQAVMPLPTESVRIVQTLGGIGPPDAKAYASALVRRLARALGASPILLPAPGVVTTAAAGDTLRQGCVVHPVSLVWRAALRRFRQFALRCGPTYSTFSSPMSRQRKHYSNREVGANAKPRTCGCHWRGCSRVSVAASTSRASPSLETRCLGLARVPSLLRLTADSP